MTVGPLTCPLSPKKRSYATEGGAAMAAAHFNGLCPRDNGDPGVEPYHCPTDGGCGRWHLRDLRKRTVAGRRELDPEGYRRRMARRRKAHKEHLREKRPEKYAADKARLRKNARENRRQGSNGVPRCGTDINLEESS